MLTKGREESAYQVSEVVFILRDFLSNKIVGFLFQCRPIPKLDGSKDSNESFMNMVEEMYEKGDDDTKRAIAKAWVQSREKANTYANQPQDKIKPGIVQTPDFTFYPPPS
jgi:hypothetical protein